MPLRWAYEILRTLTSHLFLRGSKLIEPGVRHPALGQLAPGNIRILGMASEMGSMSSEASSGPARTADRNCAPFFEVAIPTFKIIPLFP